MAFETLPVVHLERGRLPEYPAVEPERALTELARRFGRVVLVDVEGVRRNDADLEFVQQASRKRALWVDAGSRYATDAMDLFVAGADAVTMRWNTLDSAAELEEAAQLCQPGSLFLGLEFPRGGFLQHRDDKRTAADVARFAERLGVGVVALVERDPGVVRTLPAVTTPRFAQGVPARAAADLESLGFQGMLVSASELPEEKA